MHINDAMKLMLPEKHITVSLGCWQKDGSRMILKNVVCISANKDGTRLMKKVDNPAIIRRVRDYCIYEINDEEIYI